MKKRTIFLMVLDSEIPCEADREVLSVSSIFCTMRKPQEHLDYSPSEEKSDDDISRIVDTSYDSRETGEEAENKKCYSHSWANQEDMKCPPARSPEECMTRRK